jgi:imidazolonepropionase-like amidohydrolase
MKMIYLARILFLLYFVFGHLPAKAQFCIEHINIIDVENGNVIKDQTVCVEGQRIKSISSGILKDNIYPVYDCTGKFLIPGLWDMHIHDGGDSATRFEYIPLFLANGVTGVRDMWGSKEMLKLRDDINEGRFIGPRMIVGSTVIDGANPFYKGLLSAKTEREGRDYVDSFSYAGYDFIKIYNFLREPVYLAIADECKKKRIPLEGHLPIEVGLEEALDAGQRSFEHNLNINRYLTGREKELLIWSHHYLDTIGLIHNINFIIHNEPLDISPKDFFLSDSIMNKMIKNRVAVVPTLLTNQGRGLKVEELAKRTNGLEYLPQDFVDSWMQTPRSPHSIQFEQTRGEAAKFFINKGILIRAGTDVNNPFCVPGFGLQQELINLHNAGLTNLQVLQTATINPAKFLYREKELGTVAVGKYADLLILDDNPLLDISYTQNIFAVIVNGKYLSKAAITKMLEGQKKR